MCCDLNYHMAYELEDEMCHNLIDDLYCKLDYEVCDALLGIPDDDL